MIKRYVQHHEAIFQTSMQVAPVDNVMQMQIMMQDLYDTFFQVKDHHGVGLAAPQIGVPYNLFLMFIDPDRAQLCDCEPYELSFWANASYQAQGDAMETRQEGCYSHINHISDAVRRAQSIEASGQRIEYHVQDGQLSLQKITAEQIFSLSGFPARVFQHECDHCLIDAKPRFCFDYLPGGLADTYAFDFGLPAETKA